MRIWTGIVNVEEGKKRGKITRAWGGAGEGASFSKTVNGAIHNYLWLSGASAEDGTG